MVRPASFGFNPETAESNPFQTKPLGIPADRVREQSIMEFDQFVRQLRLHDVDVIVVDDDPRLQNTDAVFPNNWISFHADGQVCLYPMFSRMRRNERKNQVLDIIEQFFQIDRLTDYSDHEIHGKYLEGTGSMVFDRANHVVYSCYSNRTNPELLAKVASEMGCELIAFNAVDANKIPIYHTNVMMSVGTSFAVFCKESVLNDKEQKSVISSLETTGHQIIEISLEQMANFAGNLLEVRSRTGNNLIVLSESARRSLESRQASILECYGQLLPVSIPTIEAAGGGSVRCMMAEIFLSRRK